MTFNRKELQERGVPAEALEARQLRRLYRITQAEFAEMAGVCKSVVERWEYGEYVHNTTPAIAKIRALLASWRVVPPTPRRETRGGWKRINDARRAARASSEGVVFFDEVG